MGNSIFDIPLTKYLTDSQKQKIEELYKHSLHNGIKVCCPTIGSIIREPACVIRLFLVERFGVEACYNITNNTAYVSEPLDENGYIKFTDFRYKRSQYIMAKELGILPWTDISKYIVHHMDGNKLNDCIYNLLLLYSDGQHTTLEHRIKKGEINSINDNKNFVQLSIRKEIKNAKSNEERKSIGEYLILVNKLFRLYL